MENTNNVEGSSHDFYFFWNSSSNPFLGVPLWTPYYIEENIYLEECYSKYLNEYFNGNTSIQPEIGNYTINFKDMIQLCKLDQWRQRPIIRQPKRIVSNIQRKDRLSSLSNMNDKNQQKINIIDYKLIYDLKSFQFYKTEYVTKNFCIIKQNDVKYQILKNFDCLCNIAEIEYENFIHELKIEIKTLADNEGKNNYYEKEFINKITKDNFYSYILKMYSAQGFLYKAVNKLLRFSKCRTDLDPIKYFYNALLASIQKCSFENDKKLCDSHIKDDKILVYNTILLSVYESIFNKKENTVIIMNDFLSTSPIKNNVMNFLNDEYILLEIEIDSSFNNNYIYMQYYITEFPKEEQILLTSGSVIIFEKMREEFCEVLNKNIKIVRGCLVTLDMPGYLKYLKYDNTIKNVYLSSSDLGNQTNSLKILSDTIKSNSTIEKIDIPFNNIGSNTEAVTFLIKGLKENYSIKYLNLWDNNLGSNFQAVKELSEFIRENKSITYLNLDNNYLGDNIEAFELLCGAIKVNSSLTRINLNKNNIGSSKEALRLLGGVIQSNTSITKIDLYKNNLGNDPDGFKYICDSLKVNETIQDLNLWENNLGKNTDAMKHLSDALIENKSLKHLLLSSNNIGANNESVQHLCEAIKNNKFINFLNLYNNDFQSNILAIYSLVETIKQNVSLTFLNLEEKEIQTNSEVINLINGLLKYKKALGINF